jgi:large subunit ribosomal protein L3
MIGVDNISPTFLTAAYRRMFEQVNVPYKDRIYGFMATEDAVVPPGTVLDARHFQVGQFVSVTGKTIDWGFQGVMHRWGMRMFLLTNLLFISHVYLGGGPRLNTTKSHRRVGSVGSTGDARVWPGKRMPGHMGYEWRTAPGVEILRINPIKQIIYVKGCVPGDLEETLLIKDCYYGDKVAKNPPFPTYILGEDDVRPDRDENTLLADIAKHDIYSEKVFRFSSPSIIFTEKDETATAVRDASRAKIAKIKK